MKLKKLFQYGLMATCLFGNTIAIEDNPRNDRTLYIGIRPWDSNVQEVKGLNTAHCVDFLKECYGPPPQKLPSTFHHLDINDAGNYSSGKFSEFALMNSEKFHAIIIDWMTYHHIRRDTAWADFATLLSPGGILVIPVTSSSLKTEESLSKQRAQEIVDSKLINLFSTVKILSHDTLPNNSFFDLLRRDGQGITQCALSIVPVIIIATK